jgi:hypothetical protein
MEIKEIVSYFMNSDSNIMEVSFRTIEDNDEVIRVDQIDYSIVEEYGFDLVTESLDFFDEDEDDSFVDEDKVELDEDELITFLNEYYTIQPNRRVQNLNLKVEEFLTSHYQLGT